MSMASHFEILKKSSKSSKSVILLPLIMVYMLHATYLILGEREMVEKIQAILNFHPIFNNSGRG